MTPFSHREYKDSLITQKFTWLQTMDLVNYGYLWYEYRSNLRNTLWPLAVEILRHHYTTTCEDISQPCTIRWIISKIELNIFSTMTKYFRKMPTNKTVIYHWLANFTYFLVILSLKWYIYFRLCWFGNWSTLHSITSHFTIFNISNLKVA